MIREYLPSFLQASDDVMEALIFAIDNADSGVQEKINDILVHAFIETATGTYLDRIGFLAGIKREGRSDEDYRSAIIAKITTPAGTVGMLNNLIRTLTDEAAYIEEKFDEDGVLHFRVHANYERFWDKTPKKAFEDAVESAKAAGTVPLWYFKLSEKLKDHFEISEKVTFPKKVIEDKFEISENLQFTPQGQTLPHVEAEENLLFGEQLQTSTHEIPFVWDSSEWSLSEFY